MISEIHKKCVTEDWSDDAENTALHEIITVMISY